MKKTIKILIDVDTDINDDALHAMIYDNLIGLNKLATANKIKVETVDCVSVEIYKS